MTLNPKNWSEVLAFYYAFVRGKTSPQQAKRIENETNTAIFHYVLSKFGFHRQDPSRKMTKEETEAAKALLKCLSLQSLLKVREAIQQVFVELNVPKSSQNTYGGRINQWLNWAEQESWWWHQSNRAKNFQDQCAPPRPRKYGAVEDTKLMPGKGRPLVYSLKDEEMSSTLAEELDQLFHFLIDYHHPQRAIEKIEESTAEGYIKNIRLFLGWFYRYHKPSIPREELSLNLLFPKVDEEELEAMSPKEYKKFWRELKKNLKQWIQAYFKFLAEVANSHSPRTRFAKLNSLFAVGHFQYAPDIDEADEYQHIPLFATLKALSKEYADKVKEWTVDRRYVADQSKKWPPVPPGKTALKVVQEEIIEPLRQCCRPRDSYGNFHSSKQLACFLEDFLVWADMGIEPARRQQETRDRRISLMCPVERPDFVPLDGLYQPLPSEEVRDKRDDGTPGDVYLCRTYELEGKSYPEGIWVKVVGWFKTRKFYGEQAIIIRNREFGDGTCLYDYIEHYLYGWWLPGSFRDSQTYTWWNPELKGCRGRWITKGRMEFAPYDTCCLLPTQKTELWSWGYLFPVPALGTPYDDATFSLAFSQPAHERMGKRITPHTMRYIWATWAFQVGLSDAQLRSLASAMGTSVKTLRDMYERCTPEDKRHPIEEAIDQLLFCEIDEPKNRQAQQFEQGTLTQIVEGVHRLSPTERQQLLKLLQSPEP